MTQGRHPCCQRPAPGQRDRTGPPEPLGPLPITTPGPLAHTPSLTCSLFWTLQNVRKWSQRCPPSMPCVLQSPSRARPHRPPPGAGLCVLRAPQVLPRGQTTPDGAAAVGPGLPLGFVGRGAAVRVLGGVLQRSGHPFLVGTAPSGVAGLWGAPLRRFTSSCRQRPRGCACGRRVRAALTARVLRVLVPLSVGRGGVPAPTCGL